MSKPDQNFQAATKAKKEKITAETEKKQELLESIVRIRRVAKVVKGGRRFRLSVSIVVGDGNGKVGIGCGKAKEVPEAIRKATEQAKKEMVGFTMKGTTIPHEVIGFYKASRVLLKPASQGTGLIAGGAVRSVLSVSGIHDILTKSLGSSNALNVAKATLDGLMQLKDARKIEKMRGVKINETE